MEKNEKKTNSNRRKPALVKPNDPLSVKKLLDQVLNDGVGLSPQVREHLIAAGKAALDEFIRKESSTLAQ